MGRRADPERRTPARASNTMLTSGAMVDFMATLPPPRNTIPMSFRHLVSLGGEHWMRDPLVADTDRTFGESEHIVCLPGDLQHPSGPVALQGVPGGRRWTEGVELPCEEQRGDVGAHRLVDRGVCRQERSTLARAEVGIADEDASYAGSPPAVSASAARSMNGASSLHSTVRIHTETESTRARGPVTGAEQWGVGHDLSQLGIDPPVRTPPRSSPAASSSSLDRPPRG